MAAGNILVTERFLQVVFYSSVAACCAALGALPYAARQRLPVAWLGWANALAAGFMLGASYILIVEGIGLMPLAETLGAVSGVVVLYATHVLSGTTDLEVNPNGTPSSRYTRKLWLRNAIHSAAEGVAIGVGMALNLRFGIFIALALAAHNVLEAITLCAVLRARGLRHSIAAILCVAANLGQVVLAVLSFVIVHANDHLLAAALGFPAGALMYLVMVELLPDSFAEAGRTTIAVLASVALGVVVLLRGFLA